MQGSQLVIQPDMKGKGSNVSLHCSLLNRLCPPELHRKHRPKSQVGSSNRTQADEHTLDCVVSNSGPDPITRRQGSQNDERAPDLLITPHQVTIKAL